MECGKVPGTVLKRSVVNLIGKGPRTGIDCAAFECPDGSYVLSAAAAGICDTDIAPELAVYKAANNIWAAGGDLLGMEAVFMLNEGCREKYLKLLTRAVMKACTRCDVVLTGGHTEVSKAVNKPCATITAIGRSDGRPMNITQAKPGMDIVVSGYIGMEEVAAAINNDECRTALFERFSTDYLEVTGEYEKWLTVRQDAAIAKKAGAIAMHDASDGGIFGALWDMAEGSQTGFEIDLRAIPVMQESIEVCARLGINIYRARSSGCLIIICEDGEKMVKELMDGGAVAAVIGRIKEGNDKIIINDCEIKYLERK